MATIAEAAIKIVADGSALNKSLAGIEHAVGEATRRMADVAKTAGIAFSVAMVGSVAGVAALTKASADVGDTLNKMSQRVGIGVETLSGYGLAAGLAGVDLEGFGTSMQKASRNIVEASQGTGAAADAFDALGIRVTDGNGKLKSAEQIMLEVSDRFAGMEDGAQKTAFAMDIFGKAGAGMIPLLNQGSAAIAAQRKEAEQLGVTWTKEQAAMAEAFNDNLERIEAALGGFRNQVVSGVLPFFNQALDAMVAKIKELGESGDIKRWAITTAETVTQASVLAAQAVVSIASAAPYVIDSLRSIMAAANVMASGITTALGGYLAYRAKVYQGLSDFNTRFGASDKTKERAARYAELAASMRELSEVGSLAGKQMAESAVGWADAIGSNNAQAEAFSAKLATMATRVEEWAAKTIAAGRAAADAVGTTTKTMTFEVDGVTRSIEVQVDGFEDWGATALKAGGWAKDGAAAAGEGFTTLKYTVDGVAKSIALAVTKMGKESYTSSKEMVKALDETFKAMATSAGASLQETVAYLTKRAQLFREGTTERRQAEADLAKFALEAADKMFEHQRALGEKSLQDELTLQRQKVAATKAGTEARMKAEESVYKLEEDLRKKREQAAQGILGEALKALEEEGKTFVTAADVQAKMLEILQAKGVSAKGVQEWAAGAGGMSPEQIRGGYGAARSVSDWSQTFKDVGGPGEILKGGAMYSPAGKAIADAEQGQIDADRTWMRLRDKQAAGSLSDAEAARLEGMPGEIAGWQQKLRGMQGSGFPSAADAIGNAFGPSPRDAAAGALGQGAAAGSGPLGAFAETGTIMGKAYESLDSYLTKMEDRVQASGDRIRTTFYSNLEEWFVNRLREQGDRG